LSQIKFWLGAGFVSPAPHNQGSRLARKMLFNFFDRVLGHVLVYLGDAFTSEWNALRNSANVFGGATTTNFQHVRTLLRIARRVFSSRTGLRHTPNG